MDIKRYMYRISAWVRVTYGHASLMDRKNRAARVLEEACELAQAEGVSMLECAKITDRVYSRPLGTPASEVAGTALTLLAYCHAARIDFERVLELELARVEMMDVEVLRAKQREKFEAGTDFAPPLS